MTDRSNHSLIENVSRRGVVKGMAAGLVLSVAVPMPALAAAKGPRKYGVDGEPDGWRDDPRLFIAIAPDGHVTFISSRQEMGQGIRSSLALAMADELEADFDRVSAVQADGDQKKYGNQDTDGSRSMRHFFVPMRLAGAAARMMLIEAAAQKWGVPPSQVTAQNHVLIHTPSGRKLGFGAVAAAAAALPVPPTAQIKLKTPSEFRYIGKDRVTGVDLVDMTTGRAGYGIDVRLPDMLYAVVARPPVLGGKLVRYDGDAARKVPGVVQVLTLEQPKPGLPIQPTGGVAVVGQNSWAAIRGRRALSITWDDGPNRTFSSDSYRAELAAAVRQPGKLVTNRGDVAGALTKAARRVEAEYYIPFIAHASMEPPAATVRLVDGRCEAWACVQDPEGAREALAGALGLAKDAVTLHVTLLGGGFGRKSQPDFVVEAGLISKAMGGRPVKVLWTRDDDLKHDFYHAVAMERLEAAMDDKGTVSALLYRTCAPSIGSIFGPDPEHESTGSLGMGASDMPFDIPAVRLENPAAKAHTRIGWFRSVYNIPHAFAVQSFVAELAHAAGRDQKEFLLELIGPSRKIDPRTIGDTYNYGESPTLYPIDTGRLKGVIERVAAEIGWGRKLPNGRGLGIAGHNSFASYTACAIEVEVDDNGNITIPRADVAIDCGLAVNPDRIRAQGQGSVVMALSLALSGEITFRDGRPQQSNFDTYTVMRMDALPNDIRVHLVDTDPAAPMGGVGEPFVPPIAPALCNAIFAATGRRIRNLPIGNQLKV